jgi:hypothetical protein
MGYDKIQPLENLPTQSSQDTHGFEARTTYVDRMGKIRIDIFPDHCSLNDLNAAINFLLKLKAEKE